MRTLGKVIKISTQWKMERIVIDTFLLPYKNPVQKPNQSNTNNQHPLIFHGKINYLIPEMKSSVNTTETIDVHPRGNDGANLRQ